MEARLLEQEQTRKIVLGEHELANSIAGYVLGRLEAPGDSSETRQR